MRSKGRKLGLLFLAGLLAAGLVASVPTVATSSPESIVVTSTADSGPGTLRQALLDAQSGDTITFDTAAFPPNAPATIYVTSGLPTINRGDLTIDASNAGVILDGSNIPQEIRTVGLQIDSNGNVIRGLQIVNFSVNGIELRGQDNTIGGSRELGSGPLGQGNLLSGNEDSGVALLDAGTSFNTIVGNYIGTNVNGTAARANGNGIHIRGGSYNDVIENLVSGNSGYGIELCCTSGTSNNTISSNYVGTDASGAAALGNGSSGISIHDGASYNIVGPHNVIAYNAGVGSGIFIFEGASYNMIGPDNVIAQNTEDGIAVTSPDSIGDTIAQNSIHDNGGMAINLWYGGNADLQPPLITDFDLSSGSVVGATCPGCTVDIYSDGGDEGEVYEGRTTADSLGVFTFEKGGSLGGPHLTAAATDVDGNTSQLSAATVGAAGSIVLQRGTTLPKIQLKPKRSAELADNRIAQWCTPPSCPQDDQVLNDAFFGLGAKRARVSFNEADFDQIDWSRPEFSIAASEDGWINSLVSNGLSITYVLSFWDKANHPEGVGLGHPRFKTEEEIQRYLDYVRFIVNHFKGRVRYFEIWNEPDIRERPQWIEPADYINLVRRAVPVIRQEYPEAKIVVGGVSSLVGPYAHDYLFSILNSDVMPLVDVVSWHPMFGAAPDYEYYREYYYAYPSLVQEIKDVASAHGFEGEFEADELSYRSPEMFSPYEPWTHSEAQCGKYYARGIVMHLGMDVATGTAGAVLGRERPVTSSTVRNVSAIMAGAKPASLPVGIQSEATNIASYGFSLPNGDKLVALWTDGVAVDDDPGVEATLTFSGLSGRTVTGIDVLYGFEQQLLADTEEGKLVIRNLLVKDYPIILRLQLGVTRSLAQGWNEPCYLGAEQPLDQALSDIMTDVQAVYRLSSSQSFDRWFPGRPELSTITTVSPYQPLLILMSTGATWSQEPSGTPPGSVSLAQGWNSACYAGQTGSPADATAGIAEALSILYRLGSDQTWSRYVPDRPEVSNIAELTQYDAVLLLVTAEDGAQWLFNP